MGYWGWRPLLFCAFLSVLIAACTDAQSPTPSLPPTELPPITLTLQMLVGTAPPTAPGLPVVATLHTSPAQMTLTPYSPRPDAPLIPTPPPLQLRLPAPTCYEMLDGGVLCLGRIDNELPVPVQRVQVKVEIADREGEVIDKQTVLLEQHTLPAGASAPYQAHFPNRHLDASDTLADAFGGVRATLLRSEQATLMTMATVGDWLHIEGENGDWVEDRYIFSARLYNPNAAPLEGLQTVVTLYDERARVAGYRVVEIDRVEGGQTIPLNVEIIPQIMNVPLHPALSVVLDCGRRAGADCQP